MGKYIYGDHNPVYFIGTESQSGAWSFERVSLRCASDSINPCSTAGKLITFGEDSNREIYISTSQVK